MLDASEEVGEKDKLALVKEEDVPALKSTLYSWADNVNHSLGLVLRMQQDKSFIQSVRDLVEIPSKAFNKWE